jgi:phosphopentomutase
MRRMIDRRRIFLVILDSLGVGALDDAALFGDGGAHTLDHLVRAGGGLDAPRLEALGLGHVPGVKSVRRSEAPEACFGRCAELSAGKDTTSGHWELMGVIQNGPFPTFPDGFSAEILDEFTRRCGLAGVLCNAPASGTEVIERLGPEHLATGKPIVYTSADSVFQVAAHEEHFGLDRLLEACVIAREILDPLGVARVIARPFVGEPGSFRRTYNRRDYSLPPPEETSLDRLLAAGIDTVGIGKIEDIFAGRGVGESIHTEGNRDVMRVLVEEARSRESGLIFANLVDFDMLYGHRRDPVGYRKAIEEFDAGLAAFEAELRPDDLVILTADHGNDPTHSPGTDHTREYVPLLLFGPAARRGVALGTRASFADIGASVEELLGLDPRHCSAGLSFASEVTSSPGSPE